MYPTVSLTFAELKLSKSQYDGYYCIGARTFISVAIPKVSNGIEEFKASSWHSAPSIQPIHTHSMLCCFEKLRGTDFYLISNQIGNINNKS